MSKHQYPIHQSPLYAIRGKGQLENVLFIQLKRVNRLLSPASYRVWSNDKGREIQQPIRWLGQVHGRIRDLFARIEVPEYVYSRKGRSYVDNARFHIGDTPLGKTDISKFYPSTTRAMVLRMFIERFKCATDIAEILADICCYQQKHLPTGSPLSGYLAFFSAQPVFDDIYQFSVAHGSRMSLYVDDLTFSGDAVSKQFVAYVRGKIRQHGLKTKESKSKTFPAHATKIVTGVAVTEDGLRLPNSRHKKIHGIRQELVNADDERRASLLRSLVGHAQEAQYIQRFG